MTNSPTSPPAEARTADQAAQQPMEPLDFGLMAAAAGIWGSSFLFTAIALEDFHPGLVTLLRIGFGLVALWLLPAARRTAAPISSEIWKRLAVLGVVWMGFPLTMFPIAQQWVDSSIAGMLNAGMPIATVIVAATVFGVPTTGTKLIGVAVGLVGIALIAIPTAQIANTNAIGVLCVLAAVIAYGFAANLAGPLQQEFGAIPVVARALVAAFVVSLPYGLYGLGQSSFAWDSIIACIALGAGGTGIAYVCGAMLSGRVGAVRMSVVTYLIPIVSAVLGVWFRDETIGVLAIIGTAVVLLGAALTTRNRVA